jgi:hypothetical protein
VYRIIDVNVVTYDNVSAEWAQFEVNCFFIASENRRPPPSAKPAEREMASTASFSLASARSVAVASFQGRKGHWSQSI